MPKPKNQTDENTERFTLSKEKFEEYVRAHHKFTIETLEGESETPHLVVVTSNLDTSEDELNICCLLTAFNEAEEKRKLMLGIGAKFFEEKKIVLAIILSSECWMARRATDSDWKDVMPRDDPHRKEGIMVAGAGLDPSQRMIIMTPVRRDEKNNIVVDGKPDEITDGRGHFFLLDYFWKGYLSKFHEQRT